MKTRLAHKIINTTSVFENWDSNYQPYSVPQQLKALKTMKIPMSIRETMLEHGVFSKTPIEYRRYNPAEIAQIMMSRGMNPYSVKEYRKCMKKLLEGETDE